MSCECDGSNFVRSAAALRALTRRQLFAECGVGVGKIALASMLAGSVSKALGAAAGSSTCPAAWGVGGVGGNPMAPKAPMYAAKAKRVIYLFQVGAPSQLDLYDNKPVLAKYDGQPIPASYTKDQRYAFIEK